MAQIKVLHHSQVDIKASALHLRSKQQRRQLLEDPKPFKGWDSAICAEHMVQAGQPLAANTQSHTQPVSSLLRLYADPKRTSICCNCGWQAPDRLAASSRAHPQPMPGASCITYKTYTQMVTNMAMGLPTVFQACWGGCRRPTCTCTHLSNRQANHLRCAHVHMSEAG